MLIPQTARNFALLLVAVATVSFVVGCGGDGPKRKAPSNYSEYKSGDKPAEATEVAGNDDGAFGPAGGQMASLAADQIAAGAIKDAGSIKGKVKFAGEPTKPQKLDTGKDKWCAANHEVFAEDLLVANDGGLKNVVVYVSKGFNRFEFEPSSSPAVLDQRGCKYVPHVIAVMANQPFKVRNSDETSHNYNFSAQKNLKVNKTQPGPTEDVVTNLRKPDLSGAFQCDIHGWMRAPVRIFGHPYFAVTDDQGNFEIKNLPPGSYEVSFLHERGSVKCAPVSVTVAAGAAASADATMGG